MSYKSTHGIFALKHFEIKHQFESRINGLNKRKMGLKSKDKLLEKGLALNPIYYFFFLCNNNSYAKDKLQEKKFQKDLMLSLPRY
jgi:hypothetical protein